MDDSGAKQSELTAYSEKEYSARSSSATTEVANNLAHSDLSAGDSDHDIKRNEKSSDVIDDQKKSDNIERQKAEIQEDATKKNLAQPIYEGELVRMRMEQMNKLQTRFNGIKDEVSQLREDVKDIRRAMMQSCKTKPNQPIDDINVPSAGLSNERQRHGPRVEQGGVCEINQGGQPSDAFHAGVSAAQSSVERGRYGPSVEFSEVPEINDSESPSAGLASGNELARERSNVNLAVIDDVRDNVQRPDQNISDPAGIRESDKSDLKQ